MDKLANAIREVLESGNADIYYDESFDDPNEVSAHTKGVQRHQEALQRLSEAFNGQ